MARSTAKRETDNTLLPPALSAFLKRRASELAGLALVLLAALFALSVATYSPSDPSLNHETTGAISNVLGYPGAVVADLGLQYLGLASVIPILVLLAWGWRLASKQGVTLFWLRIIAMLADMVIAAIAISATPMAPWWPLNVSFGGATGQQLFAALLGGANALKIPSAALVVIAVTATVAFLLLAWSLGLSRREWGALFKGLWLSFKGLVMSLWWAVRTPAKGVTKVKGAREVRPKSRSKAGPERVEPTLGIGPDSEAAAAAAGVAASATSVDGPRKAERKSPRAQPPRRASGGDQGADLPPLDLLDAPSGSKAEQLSEDTLKQNAQHLESVLQDFGVKGDIVKVRPGPVVTLYELEPAPGTKTSRVVGLADDIARSMSAVSCRVATIPGRNVIGIELPNTERETVYLREMLETAAFDQQTKGLALALGKDIGGGPVIVDLARMPHLLVAGTTGSGKSVCINTMIMSLLYKHPPDDVKFIMIDPKMLELSVYDGIPHLLAPVVTEPGKAVVALKWTVREMEDRYALMSQQGVRNIHGYNQKILDAKKKGQTLTRRVQTGYDPDTGRPVEEDVPLDMNPLPYVVVVVDEMADLMMVAGKDIEAAIQRLAQMARAAGIHLIMATQRPSVDVITGTIKANFPTRVSFQVTSKIDSRTVLGEQGAEQLLGQGDMLYMAGGGRISRVHGPFVSDEEVENVVRFLKDQGEPEYLDAVTEEQDTGPVSPGIGGGNGSDELYDEAVALVIREGKASTSFVQRHLQIGYNRAARIIEQMEAEEIVSKPDRVGRREVLAGSR